MRIARFYPILDTALLETRGLAAVDAAAALIRAGVRILQYRHKGPFTRARFEEARMIAKLARDRGVELIVNDRADVALLLEAGVHLGQEDLTPGDARRVIGPAEMLGYSTHNEAQMRDAVTQWVDYVAFGPVFPTASKLNPDPTVGLDQLRAMRAIATMPLVAIGGITRDTAAVAFKAGADSVAVIADLYPAPLTAAGLELRAREWLDVTNSGAY